MDQAPRAQQVLKGLTKKTAIGGTPAKAPSSYLNARITNPQGRESREIDRPERSDLIRFSFTAYTTVD